MAVEEGTERMIALGNSVAVAQKMAFFGPLLIYVSLFIGLLFRRQESCEKTKIVSLVIFISILIAYCAVWYLSIRSLRLKKEYEELTRLLNSANTGTEYDNEAEEISWSEIIWGSSHSSADLMPYNTGRELKKNKASYLVYFYVVLVLIGFLTFTTYHDACQG